MSEDLKEKILGWQDIALFAVLGVASIAGGLAFREYNPNIRAKTQIEAKSELEGKLTSEAEKKQNSDIAFIIDPGHGGAKGENVGTTIKGYGIPERDYVLEIGTMVESQLKSQGYILTQKTREGINPKLTLSSRRAMFDSDKKNVGISIHVDGCDNIKARGAKIFYNSNAKQLAEMMAEELKSVYGSAKALPSDSYAVLKGRNPAVLVELGFGGSNAEDAKIAVEKKQEIALCLARAMASYASLKSPGQAYK